MLHLYKQTRTHLKTSCLWGNQCLALWPLTSLVTRQWPNWHTTTITTLKHPNIQVANYATTHVVPKMKTPGHARTEILTYIPSLAPLNTRRSINVKIFACQEMENTFSIILQWNWWNMCLRYIQHMQKWNSYFDLQTLHLRTNSMGISTGSCWLLFSILIFRLTYEIRERRGERGEWERGGKERGGGEWGWRGWERGWGRKRRRLMR